MGGICKDSQPGWDFAHDTSRPRFGDHQVDRGNMETFQDEDEEVEKSKGLVLLRQ